MSQCLESISWPDEQQKKTHGRNRHGIPGQRKKKTTKQESVPNLFSQDRDFFPKILQTKILGFSFGSTPPPKLQSSPKRDDIYFD